MKRLWLLVAWLFSLTSFALDAQRLAQTLQRFDPRSLETLLERLSPEDLRHHLLVYGSESLQAASFEEPRVIVHNEDATYIVAFAGKAEGEAFHDLEILRFDRKQSRFFPEVIHFDPKGQAAPVWDRKPTNCASCHQTDIRPNWDPYFHWVGFYGSEDDNYLAGQSDPIRFGPEATGLRRFRSVQKNHPRYRFLPENPTKRANLCFNDKLMNLSMRRFVRKLTEQPAAGRAWPAFDIQYSALRLDLSKLPATLRALESRNFASVRAETETVIRAAIRNRIDRHVELTGWGPVGRAAHTLELLGNDTPLDRNTDLSGDLEFNASLRYLFEEVFHEPFAPIPTSRHADFQLGTGAAETLRYLLQGASVDEKTGRLVVKEVSGEPPRSFDPCA